MNTDLYAVMGGANGTAPFFFLSFTPSLRSALSYSPLLTKLNHRIVSLTGSVSTYPAEFCAPVSCRADASKETYREIFQAQLAQQYAEYNAALAKLGPFASAPAPAAPKPAATASAGSAGLLRSALSPVKGLPAPAAALGYGHGQYNGAPRAAADEEEYDCFGDVPPLASTALSASARVSRRSRSALPQNNYGSNSNDNSYDAQSGGFFQQKQQQQEQVPSYGVPPNATVLRRDSSSSSSVSEQQQQQQWQRWRGDLGTK